MPSSKALLITRTASRACTAKLGSLKGLQQVSLPCRANIRLTANTLCKVCLLRHPQHRQALWVCLLPLLQAQKSTTQAATTRVGKGTVHRGGRSPPLGSGSWTRLQKATAALTSLWGETCCMPGQETFRRPSWCLCCWEPCDLTCHPGLSCSPRPFCAGESRRNCVHTEVHRGLPQVFTGTTPGTFPPPSPLI